VKEESASRLEVTLKRKPDAPLDATEEANKTRKLEHGSLSPLFLLSVLFLLSSFLFFSILFS
jgi:hypothetical protein